jgi:hypothetical protein
MNEYLLVNFFVFIFLLKFKFYFLEQQKNSSLGINKQNSLPHNQQSLSKSKEKSASHHMTLAEKKLNHFQKHQQSQTSSLDMNTTRSSIKSKENIKIPPKPSKVY